MGKFFKWIAGVTAGIMIAYGVATNYAFAKTSQGFSITSKNKPERSIVYDSKSMNIKYNDKFKTAKSNLDTMVSYDMKSRILSTNIKDNVHSIGSSINYEVSKKVAGVNINSSAFNAFATVEKSDKYSNIFNKYVKDSALYTPYGNFFHTRS